jgi:uncharacterized protein (TIGR02145 family)
MRKVRLVTLISGLLISISFQVLAQVAINTTGNPPANSAMLDIDAPNRGFLPPRIDLIAANNPAPVSTPAIGLLVYNTREYGTAPDKVVPGYYSWSGTRWIPVSPPTGVNQGDMAYWNGASWMIIPAGSYGQSLVFCNGVPTWGGCQAIVKTDTVLNITTNSATFHGTVESDGGTLVTARGICWDVVPTPDITGGHSVNGGGLGAFSHTFTGLMPNKTYYFRTYATNNLGTAYGTVKSFQTTLAASGSATVIHQGSTYNTVIIGTQQWLKENLNVGVIINGAENQTNNTVLEKYCFGNIEANCAIYGGLYQWDEAMQYLSSQGGQGICPAGWHIPTDAEWSTLINYLGGSALAGGKMKEAGTLHWATPNTGATNASLLTVLPGDYRDEMGDFLQLTKDAYFWSSSASTSSFAWSRYLDTNNAEAFRDDMEKNTGLSVRCIHD